MRVPEKLAVEKQYSATGSYNKMLEVENIEDSTL